MYLHHSDQYSRVFTKIKSTTEIFLAQVLDRPADVLLLHEHEVLLAPEDEGRRLSDEEDWDIGDQSHFEAGPVETEMSGVAGGEGQDGVILEGGLALDLDHGTALDGLELTDEHSGSLCLIEELKARAEICDLYDIPSA